MIDIKIRIIQMISLFVIIIIKINNRKDLFIITETALEPFPFQKEIINNAIRQVKASSKHSVFIVSPPGSGKTLMMAEIAKQFTKRKARVLFFVHLAEIIDQTRKTFKRQGVDLKYVRFQSVQKLQNREQETIDFNPDVIFVDEAHHAAASSYLKVLSWLPDRIRFFMTATPSRADGKGFEELANNDDIVLGPSVDWLIEHHYLSDFDYFTKCLYDKSKLKIGKTTGDYNQKSIENQSKDIDLDQAVDMYIKLGENKPALVYASSIAQSKLIVKKFREKGINAAHLDGGSNAEVREKTIEHFKEGKIQVLSNVQLFTEGIDLPDAAVALILRPTRSISLFYQFSMRVLRYKEGKKARIIDLAGVANDLGLPNANRDWSLLSRDIDQDKENSKTHFLFTCHRCNQTFNSAQVIKNVEQKGDQIILTVICPNDGSVIETKKTNISNDSEIMEIQEIIDKKEFSENWYQNAEILRNQSLVTNAHILLAQGVTSHDEIFGRLLNLYLPRFSKRTKYSTVMSIHGFRADEVKKMIRFLNDGKDNPEEEKAFYQGFEEKKNSVISLYAQNADLTKITNVQDLKEIFKIDLQGIKEQAKLYKDKITPDYFLNALSNQLCNALQNVNYETLVDRLHDFCMRMYRNRLLDKDQLTKLYHKIFFELGYPLDEDE